MSSPFSSSCTQQPEPRRGLRGAEPPPKGGEGEHRRGPRLGFTALVLTSLFSAPALGQQSLDQFGLLVAAQSRPSFAILGAGARAAAMGGAFTALADDASAASFNPAGLALLVTPEVSLVTDHHSRHSNHLPFSIEVGDELERYSGSRSSFDTSSLHFASATFPFAVADRNLSLQLSFHRLIDLDFASDRRFTELAAEPGGAVLADLHQRVNQQGAISTVSLAAAYQATERLSLGLTLARWQGEWGFRSETSELEGGELSRLSFSQENEWSGWNLSLGALLRYRYLNVGTTYRLPFEGDYHVESQLETNFTSPFEPRSRLDGRLRWPSSWTFGLAGKPLETWIVTVDYALYDWDDMVIEGLGTEPVSFFDLQPESTSSTRHGEQWRFGTELTFFPWGNVLGVRGGYSFEPRPERLADSRNRTRATTWSFGLGFARGPFAVDIAWQQTRTSARLPEFVDPDEVAEGRVLLPADAVVNSRDERIFVSLLYRFESRRDLKRLFHFLFVGPLEPEDPASEQPPDSP